MEDPSVPHNDKRSLSTPLRDLDGTSFEARYGCDRFLAVLLVNRFRYIIQHISTKLQANAFSPVIRDMMGFCVTISGPAELNWAVPAVSLSNPIHWGPAQDAVRVLTEEIGFPTLKAGDVIIANDSYRTGKHLNDTSFVRPVFCAERFVGTVHITAHQLDLGSRTPGAFDIRDQTIWENGLVLSPFLLYRKGVPDERVFNLLAANSRYPELLLPDLEVINTSLRLGEDLIQESIAKHGLDAYFGAIRYACDGAAESMERGLRKLPDGVYEGEGVTDSDGLPDSPSYAVKVRVAKRGSDLEFDFSGTSKQSRSSLNASWADARTAIFVALKMLFDPHSLPNSGSLRNVDIVLPPGSVVNAAPPAGTMYYFEIVQAAIQAIWTALNPALGENAIAPDSWSSMLHHAFGFKNDGRPWTCLAVSSALASQAWGATCDGDADTNQLLPWMNYADSGLEIKEMVAPMIVLRHEALADTGGAGYHRGGASLITDKYWPYAGSHAGYATHVREPSHGVCGGRSGSLGGAWLFGAPDIRRGDPPAALHGPQYKSAIPMAGLIARDTGEIESSGDYVAMSKPLVAQAGAVMRIIGNGAGGWGDPFLREPERVLRDVRDGYVSIEGAARDYEVVILGDPAEDPEGLRVDEEATRLGRRKPGGSQA